MIIRRREESDLRECVRILAEVHCLDGYLAIWPADPVGWLDKPGRPGRGGALLRRP